MRILNCYMANDSKGHFVTAKEAAKHNRQDVLCCVSCGCPLTLQRGNDGQPPWFEHDQMTVAEKILLLVIQESSIIIYKFLFIRKYLSYEELIYSSSGC